MSLSDLFHYEFVQRALLAGVLIAAGSSLLGIFLVLRRFSLIGDGLAHVTFGSVAVVILLGISPAYVTLAVLPLVIVSSVVIMKLTHAQRIHGDAAIGVVSSFGIAAGIILISLSKGYNVDLLSYLFGNILTVTQMELMLSAMVFVLVAASVILFYPDLFAITFDEELAHTMGKKTEIINTVLFILTAIAAVLAMKIAGIMLVSAMLILPPLAAMQLSASFKKTILASLLFSILSVICGMLLAFGLNLPVGGTIVILNIVLLLAVLGIQKLRAFTR